MDKKKCDAKDKVRENKDDLSLQLDELFVEAGAADKIIRSLIERDKLTFEEKFIIEKINMAAELILRELGMISVSSSMIGHLPEATPKHVERARAIVKDIAKLVEQVTNQEAKKCAVIMYKTYNATVEMLAETLLEACKTCERTDCPLHPAYQPPQEQEEEEEEEQEPEVKVKAAKTEE